MMHKREWREDAYGNFVDGDRGAYEWSKKSDWQKFKVQLLYALIWTAIVLIGIAIKGDL